MRSLRAWNSSKRGPNSLKSDVSLCKTSSVICRSSACNIRDSRRVRFRGHKKKQYGNGVYSFRGLHLTRTAFFAPSLVSCASLRSWTTLSRVHESALFIVSFLPQARRPCPQLIKVALTCCSFAFSSTTPLR